MRHSLKYAFVLTSCLAAASCGSKNESEGSLAAGGAQQGFGGSQSGGSGVKASGGSATTPSGGSIGSLTSTGGATTSGGNSAGGTTPTDMGGSTAGGSTSGGGATGGASAASGAAAVGGSSLGGATTGGSTSGGSTARGGAAAGGATAGGAAVGGATVGGAATGGASTSCTDQYALPAQPPANEDGSSLWLRYPKVPIACRLAEYQAAINHIVKAGSSATLQAAQTELVNGLTGLTGRTVAVSDSPASDGAVVLGTPDSSTIVKSLSLTNLAAAGTEGYVVVATETDGRKAIVVAANTDVGVLRGSFALLRHLQTHRTVQGLALSGSPKIKRRLLNHWDNIDGSVERGYAGNSLWSWSSLPATISQRYRDYARANASLGINGTVLNNVNANKTFLTTEYITKAAALADAFRPYGIAVYLSASFSAPNDSLGTYDPSDAGVKNWWKTKADEIYKAIPDFGGFLVKANSEGQPGPQKYNRTHAEGANMLATALGTRGIVLWRAFVYSSTSTDRIRQAYEEFKPLDGKFASNAMVQVKNGPLDFQPREPFHPLFGSMPATPLALELQVTKEYLGEDTHLAYLGPYYEEVLKADTYAKGQGSTVARVIDGTTHSYAITAISGVANIGSDTNWTGSHFNQANWYAYGRLAWDPDVSAETVADEWIRQTFSNDPAVVTPVTAMMMGSRQALVNYMTPLGLAHIMGTDHHYGPAPWVSNLSTDNWNPFYYHKADATGIGFDRTSTGSNAVEQYLATVRDKFGARSAVPEELLLFFHRVGWDDKVSSGRTVWNELVHRYSLGVDAVATMRDSWKPVEGRIDAARFKAVSDFLQIQHYEARWWRDACLQYFANRSGHSIPSGYATPAHDLAWYQALTCPSDVKKPRCTNVYTGSPSPAILP